MSAGRLGVIAGTALTLLLSGCGIGRWLGGGDSATVIEVGRAQLCSAEDQESRVLVFATVESLRDWQQRTGIGLKTGGLDPARYALLEMGQRFTGGYGIAVSREAELDGDVLKIYSTYFVPEKDQMTTQMITSPCVLVRLPAGNYNRVDVYDQAGKRRASGSAPWPGAA